MKSNSFFWALAYTLALFGTTSCTKENTALDSTLISEQTRQMMTTNLVGSWQLSEKGFEMAMHDGHICPDPANMPAGTVTYSVQWDKVTTNDKQAFKSDGTYSHYGAAASTCQGTYTISNHAVLEIKGDCQSSTARIEELTATRLTVKDGTLYYKYQKLD